MKHAIKRAKERYGLDLTVKDLDYIAKYCWAGNAGPCLVVQNIFGKFLKPRKNTKIFRLTYKGVYMEVVVQRRKKTGRLVVVTFNPPPEDGVPYARAKGRAQLDALSASTKEDEDYLTEHWLFNGGENGK